MSKHYWITRDDISSSYILWSKKPTFWGFGGWTNGKLIDSYCARLFHKLTDIRLKGGSTSIIKIKGFKALKVKL